VGVASTVIALAIGAFLAAMCGYFGGWFDSITMRICDVFTCIPSFLFALTVIAALGPSLLNLMFAITVSSVPYYIRMMRSVILSIAEEGYIEAAHACDTRGLSMIVRHILPNAIGPIIVTASMSVADMLLAMAGLSFIGLGVQPPAPEWGAMLSTAREHMRAYPYLLIFPGSLIAITALCFNLIGDGLRDAMDPRGMD
jgi:peptide/nickel transport system permease protein